MNGLRLPILVNCLSKRPVAFASIQKFFAVSGATVGNVSVPLRGAVPLRHHGRRLQANRPAGLLERLLATHQRIQTVY